MQVQHWQKLSAEGQIGRHTDLQKKKRLTEWRHEGGTYKARLVGRPWEVDGENSKRIRGRWHCHGLRGGPCTPVAVPATRGCYRSKKMSTEYYYASSRDNENTEEQTHHASFNV